jgi:hypothetical protein
LGYSQLNNAEASGSEFLFVPSDHASVSPFPMYSSVSAAAITVPDMDVHFLTPSTSVGSRSSLMSNFCVVRAPGRFGRETKLLIVKYTQKMMRFALEYYKRIGARISEKEKEKEGKEKVVGDGVGGKGKAVGEEGGDKGISLVAVPLLSDSSASRLTRRVERLENGLEDLGLYALALSGMVLFCWCCFD